MVSWYKDSKKEFLKKYVAAAQRSARSR
jgi:hypothetical protein